MARTDSATFDFYPNSPQDAAEALLQTTVKRREVAGHTFGIPIEDFTDFIKSLEDDIASALKKKGRFIRKIYIWGHGRPGYFKFGREFIGAEGLKKRAMANIEHIVPFSTIYLKGCNAAAGKGGKELLYQLGRVVFGGIPGYLWGNTREVFSLMGIDQSSGEPVEYRYPDGFGDR